MSELVTGLQQNTETPLHWVQRWLSRAPPRTLIWDYHSSPVVGFLMTLLNVRLGWWLGNPGAPGAKTWRRSGPGYSVGPLFSEAIGNTTDHYKYVNLSDGGHFENLGLYEMVLRRCHF